MGSRKPPLLLETLRVKSRDLRQQVFALHRLRAAAAKRRLSRFWTSAGHGQHLLTVGSARGQLATQENPVCVLLDRQPILSSRLLELLALLG